MKKKPQFKLYNIKIVLSVVFIFSILMNIQIVSAVNFQISNDNNSNIKEIKHNYQPIKTASQTAYLNLLDSYNTDGTAYGLDVEDLGGSSDVWIADGTNGVVSLNAFKTSGVIFYEDGFDNGGTAYDIVYANHWGNRMLVVADGEDGVEILDPEFDPLLPPANWPVLAYGGGSIENNTQSVAVYNASLYDASFDPLTFIYTQDAGAGSEVEAIQLYWDVNAILAGDPHQTDSFSTSWSVYVSRVYVLGKYLYTAGWSGVNVYDISNPSTLSYVTHCPGTFFSHEIF